VREICTLSYVRILNCQQKPAKNICLILWLLCKITEFYSEKRSKSTSISLFAKAEAMKPTKCKPKAVRNGIFLTEMYHKIAIGNERGLFIPIRFFLYKVWAKNRNFFSGY